MFHSVKTSKNTKAFDIKEHDFCLNAPIRYRLRFYHDIFDKYYGTEWLQVLGS